MAAAFTELFIDQGGTFTTTLNLTDDISNAYINLASYTAISQMRTSYYTANASANITCSFSNVSNGEITLSMTAGNTANIRAGRYVFDLKLTDPLGAVSRVIEGIAIVSPSVSRN